MQACSLALILNQAHQVTGPALGLQGVVEGGVQDHEGSRGQHGGGQGVVVDLDAGGQGEGGVLRLQHHRGTIEQDVVEAHVPVLGELPLARLDGGEELGGELADLGTEGARVEGQVRPGLVAGGLGVQDPDLLDVDLLGHELAEGGQPSRVGRGDGQAAQRLAHAQLLGLAQAQGR